MTEPATTTNDYAIDVYLLGCVHVRAANEDMARKLVYGGDMHGINFDHLRLADNITMTELSVRKIQGIAYAVDADGQGLATTVHPTDGSVDDVEHFPVLCASDDCANPLDDGAGWNGKCGVCADREAAEESDDWPIPF